jgi:electron transport complex protein RnfD
MSDRRMSDWRKTLEIRTSPHITSGYDADAIMFNVVVALAPATAFACYAFGWAALLGVGTAVASCLFAEWAACRWAGRPATLGDWSAVVTGLLFGLTLPPGLPLWMVAVGGAISIWLGKSIFGGLGFNPFNPALVGRAVLQATFPVAMTSWIPAFAADRFAAVPGSLLTAPFARPAYDALSGATPLAAWKFSRQATELSDLALGFVGGSAGETSALLIVLGGAYLVLRNFMSWRTPVAIFAAAGALAALLHQVDPARYASAGFMLGAGGLALGAVFMATDMVTSPITVRGTWAYGILIGVLVVVIRTWGGMPEGVMYAILLGNAVAPHLDRWLQPKVFGAGSTKP